MRAAVLEASEKPLAVVDDIDIEDPRAGEVRVRVSHCGVCHSDLSLANGTFPFVAPTVLGHEAAGRRRRRRPGRHHAGAGRQGGAHADPGRATSATGACAASTAAASTRSSITTGTFVDGHTPLSRHGLPVLRGVGLGGFAEYVITTETGAIKVDARHAARGRVRHRLRGADRRRRGAEHGAACPRARRCSSRARAASASRSSRARVSPGATKIIVSDPVAERRETAKRFGATDVVDPTDRRRARRGAAADRRHRRRLRVRRGRRGPRSIESCIWATRNGGTTVMVGAGGIDQTRDARAAGACSR